MKRRTFLKNTGALSVATLITPVGIFQSVPMRRTQDDLQEQFRMPPAFARPHTWWHWMNGNVTREGITLDLEAMARVGIGGFQNFDAGTGIPKGPVKYLSSEWIELKKHAIKEAERLGLEFTMHNCPGWSSSGGPWITPELSMKEVTWSELVVKGGTKVNVNLPEPLKRLDFYKDIAVVATRSLPGELPLASIIADISTTKNKIPVEVVTGEKNARIKLAGTKEHEDHLVFEFKNRYSIRQISFITAVSGQPRGAIKIQVSEDGKTYSELLQINNGSPFGQPVGDVSVTQNVDLTPLKFLRLSVDHQREFAQIKFSETPRVDNWQQRANYTFNRDGVPDVESAPAIKDSDIIDITSLVDASGKLEWDAPSGTWTILRFGYTSNGSGNRSAPDTGVGLECDKFDAKAIEFHFNKMMENLLPSLKQIAANGKAGLLIDSYEVGMQNWTADMENIFRQKAGYNMISFLPALTGRVVTDPETTTRFLWDFRRIQGDLMADNYYGKFTELCHNNKLISYCQPYDRGPMEEMQIGSRVDINVGEFWNQLSSIFQNNWTMRRTVKLSAAIAHINGQKVVTAEAFTGEPESSKWQEYPFGLKALGDKMFTQGLNRMVFHRFAHQPHPSAKPGMTMGPWGTHFDRTNTWWEQGRAWMDYLTRCQFLLQEGTPFADIVYFTGEDAGVYTRVNRADLMPSPPEGYDYDLVNAEVLLKASIRNKKLILQSGTTYSILVLQDFNTMSLPVLKKVKEFVDAGLIVIGKRPTRTPGLKTDEATFQRLVSELWPDKIIWDRSLAEVLREASLEEDFLYTSKSGNAPITFIHRKLNDADIYFIANQRRTAEDLVCSFRVSNKQPELWSPLDGTTYDISIFERSGTRTLVPVKLDPTGSLFIVFRKEIASENFISLAHEGQVVLATRPFEPKVTRFNNLENDFAITLWVKPENHIMLTTANFMDGQQPWTDFFTIYPAPGADIYGQGHATAGLTVGRNGVAVWENVSGKPEFVTSVQKALSGWNHVALVYRAGIPVIHINGEEVHMGTKSLYVVHPTIGDATIGEGASFYNGDMHDVQVHAKALDNQELKLLYRKGMSPATNSRQTVRASAKGLLLFEAGNYTLVKNKGEKELFDVPKLSSTDLSADWVIRFPADSGAPGEITLKKLAPLNEHDDAGVKYFSGTASYTRSLEFQKKSRRLSNRIILDLGTVEVMCEVLVNNKSGGVLWARPFLIDITDFLIEGQNLLEVKVTNLWPNRLIGDEQGSDPYKYAPGGGGSGFASLSGGAILELPDWYQQNLPKPEDGRVAFATWKHYTKDSPLLQSGLLGPVVLREAFEKKMVVN